MNSVVETYLSTAKVRSQAERILERALAGQTNFAVDLDRLQPCAERVVDTIRRNYPDLDIPFHSRWGHFKVGDVDRLGEISSALEELSPRDRLRTLFDLVIVSVLLDAGAGMQWQYVESESGKTFSKSEGLAVASFRMFQAGLFSSGENPLEVNCDGLRKLSRADLEEGFQVSDTNPLFGIDGRLQLLHGLADTIETQRDVFGLDATRPGDLVCFYERESNGTEIVAERILRGVQLGLGPIWPGRLEVEGVNLGDVWAYEPFGADWVPFHKLPQWLTYSLIEPLEEFGLKVVKPEGLTGLAEYRNGGLFVDFGVLSLRDAGDLAVEHSASSELIIEWRALTLALLDRIAPLVRGVLNLSEASFPLGKVLEGGTWATGRELAQEARSDGGPPLNLKSDGTVF